MSALYPTGLKAQPFKCDHADATVLVCENCAKECWFSTTDFRSYRVGFAQSAMQGLCAALAPYSTSHIIDFRALACDAVAAADALIAELSNK